MACGLRFTYGSSDQSSCLNGIPADGLVSMAGYAGEGREYKTVIVYSHPLSHEEKDIHHLVLLSISHEYSRSGQ